MFFLIFEMMKLDNNLRKSEHVAALRLGIKNLILCCGILFFRDIIKKSEHVDPL